VRLGAVKQIIVEDGEHGMVFDHNICIVAGHVVDWFVQESERWMGGHRKRLDTWQKKTLEEQQRVRDEYAAAAGWLMEQKRTVKL
jgi:hypothetical protein